MEFYASYIVRWSLQQCWPNQSWIWSKVFQRRWRWRGRRCRRSGPRLAPRHCPCESRRSRGCNCRCPQDRTGGTWKSLQRMDHRAFRFATRGQCIKGKWARLFWTHILFLIAMCQQPFLQCPLVANTNPRWSIHSHLSAKGHWVISLQQKSYLKRQDSNSDCQSRLKETKESTIKPPLCPFI